MRPTATQVLRMRQRCHDLHAEGKSPREIQAVLDIALSTACDWLSRPRPTDEEIAALPANKTDVTGQVGFKSRFDPDLFARLRAEADRQGIATNKVLGCAVQLYLDVMDRARAGGGEPINVTGYR